MTDYLAMLLVCLLSVEQTPSEGRATCVLQSGVGERADTEEKTVRQKKTPAPRRAGNAERERVRNVVARLAGSPQLLERWLRLGEAQAACGRRELSKTQSG